MNKKIPCTVAILTRNSATTVSRCIASVSEFAEVIICDSNSVDETLDLARSYGAQVIAQDPQFLYPDGRIQNFSGVRNQTLTAASYDWFFFLDSDEYIDEALAKEITEKTDGAPSAYWIPRKYVYQGTVIDCSVTYPSQQMRLFHKEVVQGFIKEVHEKIELRTGVVPLWLTQPMYVPISNTASELMEKWEGYLRIEGQRRVPLSFRQWLVAIQRDVGITVLYLWRLLSILLWCRGARFPVSYELARVWYQYALVRDSFRAINRL